MGVYDRPIATAQRLIRKYGEACEWQKPAPITETVPGYPTVGETPDPIPCYLAFFSGRDLGRGRGLEAFLAMMKDMEVPVSGEFALLAGGIDFAPENTDTISRADGTQLAIKDIDRVAPGGVPVLYYVAVAT